MSNSKDKILWVDCLGGLFVGGAVLSICKLLSDWESLPTTIVFSWEWSILFTVVTPCSSRLANHDRY